MKRTPLQRLAAISHDPFVRVGLRRPGEHAKRYLAAYCDTLHRAIARDPTAIRAFMRALGSADKADASRAEAAFSRWIEDAVAPVFAAGWPETLS